MALPRPLHSAISSVRSATPPSPPLPPPSPRPAFDLLAVPPPGSFYLYGTAPGTSPLPPPTGIQRVERALPRASMEVGRAG